MMSRASMLGLLPLALLSSLAVGACGGDPSSSDGASGAMCDLNPEGTVTPKLAGSNGQNLNNGFLNGQQLNNGYLNGQQLNSGYVNGQQLNNGFMNGIQLQGLQLNGIQVNGARLNGVQNNGIQNNGVQINGTGGNELVGTLADGTVLRGDAFVGASVPAILSDGRTIALSITGFDKSADGALAYYTLDYEGQNICGEGVSGMFLPGAWDERAARHDELDVHGAKITTSYSCTTGVLAKCIAWGYAPWKKEVGADLHQTCTRMARADYCGTGVSFTKNGTLVDLYDDKGVQSPTIGDASLLFEAGWGPNGAVCGSRTRYEAHTTKGELVMPSCWANLPKCGSFEEAKTRGATIGNSSRIQSRTLCAADR